MTTILLVRHGMTDYVARHICAGRTPGVSLNAEGQAQAAAAAERLRTLPVKAVYSSPLERTMETARAIAGSLGLSVEPCAGLLETDTGDWTGLPFDEIQKTHAATWTALQEHPSATRIPGGETMHEIQARMSAALQDMCARHPGKLVVAVSHADPIKAVLAHYLGLDLDNMQRLVIGPTSVSAVQIDDHRVAVLTVNNTGDLAHLAPRAT